MSSERKHRDLAARKLFHLFETDVEESSEGKNSDKILIYNPATGEHRLTDMNGDEEVEN